MNPLPVVMLVDDDPITNHLNERLLRQLGVWGQVLVATNGQQALTMLHEYCRQQADTCPVLVLVDVNMPVMNGFEFLEAYGYKLPTHHRSIVFVLLTNSQLDQDMVQAQHLPVTDFLTKPLTREKLLEVLNRYFDYPNTLVARA